MLSHWFTGSDQYSVLSILRKPVLSVIEKLKLPALTITVNVNIFNPPALVA
jgi:hypothetical protein